MSRQIIETEVTLIIQTPERLQLEFDPASLTAFLRRKVSSTIALICYRPEFGL
ncbi:MAG: hypothetical protein ABR530_10540 [Pyrinomonadaceae bacterium]